ncbi:MAG: GNAT family N-acetyltransferase [Candidatus Bathyarchaeota archaeon]|nr:GNAT family N-acetyltransferase [Candidatus Bathyarchaeota archaeon]
MEESREFPRLETDRLILREMTPDDVEFYFRHFNNKEVVEGSCFPGPKTLEAATEELELYCIRPFKENRGIRWGIARKGNEELIGTCGYYDWNKTSRRAEVGYDLEPAHWGESIMTEALRAVLRYGFEEMALNRIQAIIDSENMRSIKLVERLGFRKEGVLRQNSYFRGKFRDEVCFSLLKEEWTKS